MADLQKSIEIIFGGKDNLSPTTKALTKEIGSFDTAVQGAVAPIGNFTESLLKTEAVILALGLAMAGVAINQAGEFTGSIAEIGTLFNGTTEEVKQLETAIIEYARSSSSSIDEINQAAYIAISTGAEWAEVTETLAAAEQLATAGATDLASATGALQRVMNSYGLETKEATSISEALFVTVQNGDTTMEKLASNIGKVASIASGAGVGIEELLSAVAALTIGGLNTEESMTGLKALFKDLADPSKELAAVLGDMSLRTNSLQEIMQKLQTETGGSLEEFNKLFPSIRAGHSAMILANDAAGAFNGTLEAMNEKAGKLAIEYEKMSLIFSNVNQTLVNNIRATLIQTGIPLLDEYGTAVKALTEIFKSIGTGVQAPSFDAIYSAIEVFVNNFSAKMDDIANALPEAMAQIDFSDLIRSFSDLSETVGGALDSIFGADLDLSKPEDLAKALQSAVNILTTFVDLTTGIVTGLEPIFDVLGEAATQTGKVGEEAAKATGEVLGAITLLHEFGTALGVTLILIKESEADITNVFATLEGMVGIVINAMQMAFDAFAVVIFRVAATMAESLNLVSFGDVAQGFRDSAAELKLLADAAAENLKSNANDMGEAWGTMTSGISGDAAELKEAMSGIEHAANSIVDDIFNFGEVADKAGDGVKNLGDKADAAKQPIGELSEDLRSLDGVEVVPSTIPENIEKIGETAESSGEKYGQFIKTMIDGVPTFTKAGEALEEVKTQTKLSSEEAKKAEIAYAKLEVDLEKIASNERIKNMEFTVDLEIARVEAQAKQMVAAFDSVATSYVSTQNLIGDLFGQDAPDWDRFGFATEASIQSAEQRAEDLKNAQIELIDAQIKQMEASTRRMNSGDALITVDGGDLQPELQAIMESLFASIRIEMSSNYESFLLGTL